MDASNLTNSNAEWSVVASMLANPDLVPELVGMQIEGDDFVRQDTRTLFCKTVESYYADRPIETLIIAEAVKNDLARVWDVASDEVADGVLQHISGQNHGEAARDHAGIVKRLATSRRLLEVVNQAATSIMEGKKLPEEVASIMGADALAVTGGLSLRSEIRDWMSTGRDYAKYLQVIKTAHEEGHEQAVFCGQPCVDDYTRGILPGEMWVLGGMPGVGKSSVAWSVATGFAEKQMRKQPHLPKLGTLIVSMEMGLVSSATRLAQSITNLDGMKLRAGEITDPEYKHILREWLARDGLPIYFNYASNFRLSQLRALITEAVRRHNVGLVVIDHFRQLDTDRYVQDPLQADEIKARFLKESIAKDLNVSVICLAHTVKLGGRDGNPRPTQADLRGSGQIAAATDFLSFLHKPGKNLDYAQKAELGIRDTDMEMLWEKARHTQEGHAQFTFDPSKMTMSQRT